MFTGIVEELGELVGWDQTVVTLRGPKVAADARPGDSISVNGVCLTVVEPAGGPAGSLAEPSEPSEPSERPTGQRGDAAGLFSADVMRETLERSTLGMLKPGDPVNLERAATVVTRLGGHIVQGHVDGVGTVLARTPGQAWETVRVALPPGLARYVVEKGSIAVDGVSLTVTQVTGGPVADEWFEVSLIPTTLERTTLGRKQVGELVNLEVDVIAKYVEKQLAEVRL